MQAHFSQIHGGAMQAAPFLVIDLTGLHGLMQWQSLVYGRTVQKVTRYQTEVTWLYEGGLMVRVTEDAGNTD